MAEKVLSNIVEGIMNSLNGPLADILELKNLRDTVSAIKAVILRAEEQLAPNPDVNHWLQKISDVLYDADDLLDAASTEALRQVSMAQDGRAKKVHTFFSKTYQFALGGIMGGKVKAIGEKLDAIKAGIETFQFQDAKIIGREDDKKAVINDLLDSNVGGNVSFLPIVGRRGLGKTTLAQLIYHDEVITGSFDLKMWVFVGDTFDIRIIVRKLLESASRKIEEISGLDGLKDEFLNVIAGRKYFLVLDDLCNEDSEKWSELQNLLMNGARGSRILITTRSENVAKTLLHPRKPYYLRGLTDKDSWHLFVDLTFPALQRLENPDILEMARKIVQRCAGIPLITRMVASDFLYFENSEARCCDFMEKLLKSLQDEHDVLPPSPQLSYYMLPSHLKCCFAFCSLFPKGYTISKTRLIKLWIAQGFVKSQENLCLEDVGHEYFMNLLRDQFFHEPNLDDFGNIISCKMHDLMHELAILMTGPLISMLEKRKINKKTRHVGFINFPPTMPSTLYRVGSIRTFLCSNFFNFEGECDCETIFSSFKLLRVLDLNYRDLTHVPSSIGKLKHLRYLDLSYNKEIVKLPKSITSLLNLQTIRLSCCWSLKELPKDIKRLVNLRHLELDDCWELKNMPYGLGHLTNLQTLTLFIFDSSARPKQCAGLNELSGLSNLRGRLLVRDCYERALLSKKRATNLKGKRHLTSLRLSSSLGCDVDTLEKLLELSQKELKLKQLVIEECWSSRFLSWLLSLTSLVELKLLHCKKCQCLPRLSQLYSLKCLWLEEMDDIQYISECDNQNELSSFSSTLVEIFPAPETIHVSDCPKLVGWWRDSSMEVCGGRHSLGHHLLRFFPRFFPRLSSLYISKCPLLIFMPLSHSCFLKCLWLEEINAIEYISECGDQNELSSSSLTPVEIFPALETIHLSNCPKLKGWWRDSSMEIGGGSHSSEHQLLPLFPCLSSLHISKCPLFISMALSHSRSLKCLWLEEMDAIEYISEYGDQNELSSSSSILVENFPVLETIHLSSCPKLKGWWRDSSMEVGDGSHGSKHHPLPLFPRLSSLHISKCPHLIFMARFPYLEELYLEHASWEPFLQTMITSASSFAPLSKCRTITLVSMMDVKTKLEDWLRKLTCLWSLSLKHCDDLRYLSVRYCDELTSLTVERCGKLESLTVEPCDKLESLTVEHCDKLEYLTVEYCDKLESLMIKHSHVLKFLEVRHLTALDKLVLSDCYTLWSLEIRNCENLTAMPECNSLEVLEIVRCPKLTSLPGPMPRVHYLYIEECPTLMERCKEVEGEDWPKIKNIPDRIIE